MLGGNWYASWGRRSWPLSCGSATSRASGAAGKSTMRRWRQLKETLAELLPGSGLRGSELKPDLQPGEVITL